MEIIKLTQNTPDWERWRSDSLSLGASDAPAIWGVDKYTSPRMLFEEKLYGRVASGRKQLNEFLIEKSRLFEARGHAMSGLETDREYKRGVCAEHSEFRFIKASFDGLNVGIKRFWENKYVGVDNYMAVRNSPQSIHVTAAGKVPAAKLLRRYLPQLCQQSFVSGFLECDFTVYNDQEDDTRTMEITFDPDYVKRMMEKVFAFRDLLVSQTPPPLTNLDTLELTDAFSIEAFSHLMDARHRGDKVHEKQIRECIIDMLPHSKVNCMGVKVTRTKDGKHVFKFPHEQQSQIQQENP